MTVRRSKRTLMLGWSSFAAFFLRAECEVSRDSFLSKEHIQAREKLPDVHKVHEVVKETWRCPPPQDDIEGTKRPAYHAMYR